jgi:hypothetical protein
MQHIDEHTLELYVLKAGEIADRIDDIEAHLQECSGCQALVNEMSKFYDDLKHELQNKPETEISAEKALVRKNIHLSPVFERNTPAFRYRPSTPLAKIFYFVRRHPVSVGLGSFALVAAFGWWMNSFTDSFSSFFKDKSPHTFYYNTGSNSIVVLNEDKEDLWVLKADNLDRLTSREDKYGNKYTYLEDLNNDGEKELITTASPAYEANELPKNDLRIYNREGVLLKEIPFYEPFNYLDRDHYNFNFSADPLLIYTNSLNHAREIFVGAVCVGGSPNFIARINAEGKILGKYWHHGAISGMFLCDINGDGGDEIIAYGQNDAKDTPPEPFTFGVIIVLDPLMISENEASSATPGYKFNYSDAELFYILFPLFDVNFGLSANSSIEKIEKVGIDKFKATLRLNSIEKGPIPPIYFSFSKDLHLLDVNPSDEFNFTYSEWKTKGIVKSQIDNEYIEGLKKGIKYWDGKEWQGEWAVVKH